MKQAIAEPVRLWWLLWWAGTEAASAQSLGERALELAHALVSEVGPRPADSPAGARAQRWVSDQLEDRGWSATQLFRGRSPYGAVIACREGISPRVVAFFAHTDTVPGCPGANDNAAAVATLLVAAEVLADERLPRRTCLVFPDAEELGLLGSRNVAVERERWLGGPVDQVVALDLVGRGQLTHHGLGPPFGPQRLRALLQAAPASVPWVYRALSQGRPLMERSDHAWFTLAGIPASHLMARAESGVFFAYHTADDTLDQLQTETLDEAVRAVLAIARMPPLPEEEGGPAIVLPWLGWVLPTGCTWASLALGPLLGLVGTVSLPRGRVKVELAATARWLAVQGLALGASGLLAALASRGEPWHLARADGVVAAAWGGWGLVQARFGAGGASPAIVGGVVASTLALAMVAAGLPLLGVPFALTAAALGARRWMPPGLRAWPALVSAWVPLYLVRADAIRELAHHGLMPADLLLWVPMLGLLTLPLASTLERPARPLALPFLLLALMGVGLGWTTPEQLAPYVRGEVLE